MDVKLYSKAAVQVALRMFLEQAPSLFPGGNLLSFAAKVIQEAKKIEAEAVEAEAETAERLTEREVEGLVDKHFAAHPEIPEATKTEMRNAFLSEIGLLLEDLRRAEEEEAKQSALAEATARKAKVSELTDMLKEQLKARNYDTSYSLAKEILKIDPRNRDAIDAKVFCRPRTEFDEGSAARGFLIFLAIVDILMPALRAPFLPLEGWLETALDILGIVIFCCVFGLVEKYWVRLSYGIRRPANWVINGYAVLVIAGMLWSCVSAR